MKKVLLFIFIACISAEHVAAQKTLPAIEVTNYSDNIIINWRNAYKLPVTNISIQRSYDSLKNYSTIGTVLNPQNEENGYSDNAPPYNKMYYRLFIAFEGGSYIIGPATRPVKMAKNDSTDASQPALPWQVDPRADTAFQAPPPAPPVTSVPIKDQVVYPSLRIFTAKDNTVVIHLPDAAVKKYTAKFYNDANKRLFELSSLKEEYLIIEKVNFGRAGWYFFELFEDGKLLEKNRFFIPKDVKVTND